MKRAVWTGWVLAAFVMIFPSSGWGAECEDVAPGVQYCKETMTPPGSSGSVTNHWTLIDLTEPSLQVRVTRENEGFKKPSTIANTLDTTVTINGDWINFNTNKPVGLSVGAGVQWPGSVDQGPSSSLGDWGTLSCDPGKVCQMSPINVLWEYFPPLDHNVIGGNGQRLVIDGVVQYPAFDNQRRPRSGVCINATSSEMMLLVGEGEAGGVNKGWKTQDFAAYAHQLGCYNGLMLDGEEAPPW